MPDNSTVFVFVRRRKPLTDKPLHNVLWVSPDRLSHISEIALDTYTTVKAHLIKNIPIVVKEIQRINLK